MNLSKYTFTFDYNELFNILYNSFTGSIVKIEKNILMILMN